MKFKKLKHYNNTVTCHELTFSCYHNRNYLTDNRLCDLFEEVLSEVLSEENILLLAYVLMPNHVHLLVLPQKELYSISRFLKLLKGRVSNRYSKILRETDVEVYRSYLAEFRGSNSFILWQRGGGYDRNIYSKEAIISSMQYIEANPVRKSMVTMPVEYRWSSAYSRKNGEGIRSDSLMFL